MSMMNADEIFVEVSGILPEEKLNNKRFSKFMKLPRRLDLLRNLSTKNLVTFTHIS